MALDFKLIFIAEDIGFNCFVKAIELQYSLPSRKYFSETLISRIHDGDKAEHMTKVHSCGVITYSFTCSMEHQHSRIVITKLNNTVGGTKFKKNSTVLHVMALESSCTGMYIAKKFRDMHSNWNISKEKVHLVLRDNASNMEKAMKGADLKFWVLYS